MSYSKEATELSDLYGVQRAHRFDMSLCTLYGATVMARHVCASVFHSVSVCVGSGASPRYVWAADDLLAVEEPPEFTELACWVTSDLATDRINRLRALAPRERAV